MPTLTREEAIELRNKVITFMTETRSAIEERPIEDVMQNPSVLAQAIFTNLSNDDLFVTQIVMKTISNSGENYCSCNACEAIRKAHSKR